MSFTRTKPSNMAATAAIAAFVFYYLCPCSEAQEQPAQEPASWCGLIAARGALTCETETELRDCPTECRDPPPGWNSSSAAAAGKGPPPPPEREYTAGLCAVLIDLEDGCAHDLSLRDPDTAPGTRVGDVCPVQCSGHSGCSAAVVDVSFLGLAEDSSGHGCGVHLGGDACVDSGGVTTSGGGTVAIEIGGEYAAGGAFSVSLWLLKPATVIWEPREYDSADWRPPPLTSGAPPYTPQYGPDLYSAFLRREVLYAHPASTVRGGDRIEISLIRGAWLGHHTLIVDLGTSTSWQFPLSLYRDEVPIWTQLTVTVANDAVRLYDGGSAVVGEPVGVDRLASGFVYVGCFLDYQQVDGVGCSQGGVCRVLPAFLDNVATSAMKSDPSVVQACFDMCPEYRYIGLGFGSECHCDNEPGYTTHPTAFSEVDIDDCDSDGVLDNGVADACASSFGSPCGQRNAIYERGFAVADRFRGTGLSATAFFGGGPATTHGLSGTMAMVQLYPAALDAAKVQCIYDNGVQLVQSGRLAILDESDCRQIANTGCTSTSAQNADSAAAHQLTYDDGSCEFGLDGPVTLERGFINVTDGWQVVHLSGSYTNPLVFCGAMSRSSTAEAIIRIGRVQSELSGSWSFEVRAEQ